jgi:subfamily B ATP-binding cassette protein HlyB/CyaB
VIDLLFTVVFFAVMVFYSPVLTLIVAASIPVFAAIVLAMTPPLRRRIEEKFNRGAENQAFLFESVAGIETMKSMAVEPQFLRRWEEQTAGYMAAGFRVATLANTGSHLIQMVARLVTAAILWFGAHQVIDGAMTVGAFVAFNMFVNHVISPVLRMA